MKEIKKTYNYDQLIKVIESGGAVNLDWIKDSYLNMKGSISQEQEDLIKDKISFYVIDNLYHGQIGNLKGLDKLLEKIDVGQVSIDPKINETINFYNNHLTAGMVEALKISIKPEEVQEAIDYLQGRVPFKVTEETVKEIRKYGEVLLIMKGKHICLVDYTKFGRVEKKWPSVVVGLKKFFGITKQIDNIKEFFIEQS